MTCSLHFGRRFGDEIGFLEIITMELAQSLVFVGFGGGFELA